MSNANAVNRLGEGIARCCWFADDAASGEHGRTSSSCMTTFIGTLSGSDEMAVAACKLYTFAMSLCATLGIAR